MVQKIRAYRNRTAIFSLLLSLSLFIVVDCLGLECNFILMRLYGWILLAIYFALLWSEFRFSGLNLYCVYVIGITFRLALPVIILSNAALNGDSLIIDDNDVTGYVFKTSLAMNSCYMLFILLLSHFLRKTILCLNLSSYFYSKKFLKYIFGIYAFVFLIRIFPYLLSFSDTIRFLCLSLSYVVLLFLAFYCAYNPKDKKVLLLFFLIDIIEILYHTLFGFFKGPIAISACFLLLYYFFKCKFQGKPILSFKFTIYLSVFLSFLLLFIYPFISIKRIVAQVDPSTGVPTQSYSNLDIIRTIASYNLEDVEEGNALNELMERESAILPNAQFYMFTKQSGTHQEIIINNFRMMIPAIINPNKKRMDSGRMVVSYAQSRTFDSYDIQSSGYCGVFGGSFFWGGILGVILTVVINAFVISRLLKYGIKNIDNPLAVMLIVMVLMNAVNAFEEVHDGGIIQNVNYLLMLLLVYLITQIFRSFKRLKLVK